MIHFKVKKLTASGILLALTSLFIVSADVLGAPTSKQNNSTTSTTAKPSVQKFRTPAEANAANKKRAMQREAEAKSAKANSN